MIVLNIYHKEFSGDLLELVRQKGVDPFFYEILKALILQNIGEWLLLKIISKFQQTFYSFYLTSINIFTLVWLTLIELLLNSLIKLN